MNIYEVQIVSIDDHVSWETVWVEALSFQNLIDFVPTIFEDKGYDPKEIEVGNISLVGKVDYITSEAGEEVEMI